MAQQGTTKAAIRVTKTVGGNKRHKRSTEHERTNGNRDPNEKFRQLAMKRVPRVLREMKLIENLASHNYKYTHEQAEKVIRILEDGLQKIRDAFNKPRRVEPAFRFEI